MAANNFNRQDGTFSPIVTGDILGTTTSDSASAGIIGEFFSSTRASGAAISLTNGSTANVSSMPFQAGDYDIAAWVEFHAEATTTVTVVFVGVNTTSATLNTNPGKFGQLQLFGNAGASFGNDPVCQCNPVRFSFASSTTVFLCAQGGFAVSSLSAYGEIRARRIR